MVFVLEETQFHCNFIFLDQESCQTEADEEETSSSSGETRYNSCSETSLATPDNGSKNFQETMEV